MTATNAPTIDDIARTFRTEYARAVAAIARATDGDLQLAERATDDAYAEALHRWPHEGIPARPAEWIVPTARRALARLGGTAAGPPDAPGEDELAEGRPELIFTCCHPALALPAQVALTLRLVAGLSVAEIADVFRVPEARMAQRLERAKAAVGTGLGYGSPDPADRPRRLQAVAAVHYLIFNESYIGSQSTTAAGRTLGDEAIAMTRTLLELWPDEHELRGLLALMLFIHARRDARIDPHGHLIALADQDRSRWDPTMIAEARFLLRQAERGRTPGRYTVEARIQAEHAATLDGSAPNWRRILAAYDQLRMLAPSAACELNRAVALAEVEGAAAALRAVDRVPAHSHLWCAVRADLLARLGRTEEAEAAWRAGAELGDDPIEQAYMAPSSVRDQPSCEAIPGPYGETMPATPKYTVPGLSLEEGQKVAALLQERLNALNDLMLTLKHVHWNVVGPHFIAVHEMIDPHVVEVREMVDETAERIATLGVAPLGTPSAIVEGRTWKDYSLGRATTIEHLKALDEVYVGLLDDHRKARAEAAEIDPITEDMLIGQIKTMELFHWFVRAHLENQGGQLES